MDISPDPLTQSEIQLVKDKWDRLLENENSIRKTFYEKIFEMAPETKTLFRESFLDLELLPDSWYFMYNWIENLASAIPDLLKLGLKHKTYKISKQFYLIGRKALSFTLMEHLGDDFTDELNDAWTKLFDYMTYYMIAGMQRRKITI